MSWISEIPLAHRGRFDDVLPENTIQAFLAARQHGHGVELDVHLSADGHVVVVHDDDLRRLTGTPASVRRSTLAELQALALFGTEHRIPLLGEVLDALAGDVPIMIEIKNPGASVGPLEHAVVAVTGARRDDVAIASFNPRTVHWFRLHAPELLRGQTAGAFQHAPMPVFLKRWLRRLGSLRWTDPHYVSYEVGALPNPATIAWRASGKPLVAWTVRTPDELDTARRHADNLIYEGAVLDEP